MERTNVNVGFIKETKIEIAEEDFIRPVIGLDLYKHLNQDNAGLTADEVVLKALIKVALAYYVKYQIIPDISVQFGNRGLQMPGEDHSQRASDAQRGELRHTALENGHTLMKKVTRYLEDNLAKFPLYNPDKNSRSNVRKRGGLIL